MNPDLDRLQPYPFERLRELFAELVPPAGTAHVSLSIGEPRHPAPPQVVAALVDALDGLGSYPLTAGSADLRAAIAAWCTRRFALGEGALDPERHVLPVSGSREALFSFTQCVVDRGQARPRVLMPNPFYQVYEGAALLAGADPWYIDCTAETAFQPDLDTVPETVWNDCQMLVVCSPSNPTGAVLDAAGWRRVLDLADRYGFVVASDECYSEIYADEATPPPGLLAMARDHGRTDYENCIVFNSLSKRSSVPGLRSGFVAGDADLIARYRLYRSYHGATMPPPTQVASAVAWRDEAHVVANRALYREKFAAVVPILDPVLPCTAPPGGFYLWPRTPVDDREFAAALYAGQNLTVLPGRFLSRATPSGDPGADRVRLALVASVADCVDAANRIRAHLEGA